MAPFPAEHPLAIALAERAYTDLTPVQSAVSAPECAGCDLLVSAQTGSGKTVAYGLALAGDLLDGAFELPRAGEPMALIVAPTRELALQVQRELEWLYAKAGGRIASCVGGMDYRAEQRVLARGAHIVVGTPGRLRDHLERGGLRIGALQAVVLDEADEMLDMGFREDLEFILEATPHDRRTLLFSATLPRAIENMARQYQRDAQRIAVRGETRGHADIEYRAVRVAPNEIEHAVVNVLRFIDAPTSMIFCNTRESVRHLQAILLERGFAAVALSGELSQNERNHALSALRDGRARVCVATDVAARGIDLPGLGLVIHADLPMNAETLQHRSGRTGRAGRKGVSVLLVQLSRRRKAESLLSAAGVQAEWSGAPSPEEIHKLDVERFLKNPMLTQEAGEDERELAQILLQSHNAESIAAALARMYLAGLPAAEEVFDPGPGRPLHDSRAPREPRDMREPREPRAEKSAFPPGASAWFRLNIGRQKNADPRWLIPLICRQGKITKQDIGAIRIFDRETRFEIQESQAEHFLQALTQGKRADVRIEPVADDAPPERAPRAERPDRGDRPARPERSERSERPARPERTERSERPAGKLSLVKPFRKADKPGKPKDKRK